MKLKVKQRNWFLSLHISSGGLWFGAALCSVVLALKSQGLSDGGELYGIDMARSVIGEFIIVPAAIISVITGVLLCSFTNWGLFKHYWVMVKQLGTLVLILVGSIWLGPWTEEITEISHTLRLQALQNLNYLSLQSMILVVSALETLALLVIIIISTLKPWGRRKATQGLKK